MSPTALILDGQTLQRQSAKARPAQAAAAHAPVASATAPAVWPPAVVDFNAYRAEAKSLRAQAIGGALMAAAAWLRGLVTAA